MSISSGTSAFRSRASITAEEPCGQVTLGTGDGGGNGGNGDEPPGDGLSAAQIGLGLLVVVGGAYAYSRRKK